MLGTFNAHPLLREVYDCPHPSPLIVCAMYVVPRIIDRYGHRLPVIASHINLYQEFLFASRTHHSEVCLRRFFLSYLTLCATIWARDSHDYCWINRGDLHV